MKKEILAFCESEKNKPPRASEDQFYQFVWVDKRVNEKENSLLVKFTVVFFGLKKQLSKSNSKEASSFQVFSPPMFKKPSLKSIVNPVSPGNIKWCCKSDLIPTQSLLIMDRNIYRRACWWIKMRHSTWKSSSACSSCHNLESTATLKTSKLTENSIISFICSRWRTMNNKQIYSYWITMKATRCLSLKLWPCRRQ